MTREQKEVKLRMILQDYHRRNDYELQQAVNDILALDPLPPAEGAEPILLKHCKENKVFLTSNELHTILDAMREFAAQQQPTAEGAENVPEDMYEKAEAFLQSKDVWNHPYISDRENKTGYEVTFLIAEFATLHAQRIADKMVDANTSYHGR